jgi:ABC-type branched-subunit amino acid transport system ATPase component
MALANQHSSTLLTGVYQPDAGSYIEFDNIDVTGKPAHYIAEHGAFQNLSTASALW